MLSSPIEVRVEAPLDGAVLHEFVAVHHPAPVAAHKIAVATAQFDEEFGLYTGRVLALRGLRQQKSTRRLAEQAKEARHLDWATNHLKMNKKIVLIEWKYFKN